MAILIVLGLMNLVWMIALSAVFLLEKNWRGGVLESSRTGASAAVTTVSQQKVRPPPGGGAAAREPGLGTGRGGDVTGVA